MLSKDCLVKVEQGHYIDNGKYVRYSQTVFDKVVREQKPLFEVSATFNKEQTELIFTDLRNFELSGIFTDLVKMIIDNRAENGTWSY